MNFIKVHHNVESGQCVGALVRIQIRTTAIFLFSGLKFWFRNGFTGTQIGLFAPNGYENGKYKFTKFYFRPSFAPRVPYAHLPAWYRRAKELVSFG